MAPDYAHWHGMYEVSERFYMELIPQARELIGHAREEGKTEQADAVEKVITEILSRKEHKWSPKFLEKGKQSKHGLKPAAERTKPKPVGDSAKATKPEKPKVPAKKDAPK